MVRSRFASDPRLTRRMVLSLALVALSYAAGVGLALWAGASWPAILAFCAAAVVAQYVVATTTVGTGMRKHAYGPDREPVLHATVDRLCALTGTAKPRIRVVELDAPNAFAYGRGGRMSTLCLTRGLLDRLEPVELEGVVAHELSHIAHRDALVMTLASFPSLACAHCLLVLDAGGEWLEARMRAYDRRHGVNLVTDSDEEKRDGGPSLRPSGPRSVVAYLVLIPATTVFYLGFGLSMAAFGLFSALVAFLGLFLTQPLSRTREFAADRAAALVTGRPSALASALLKIGDTREAVPSTDARALDKAKAFCLVPMSAGAGGTVTVGSGPLSSHPPISERVDRLTEMSRRMGATAR